MQLLTSPYPNVRVHLRWVSSQMHPGKHPNTLQETMHTDRQWHYPAAGDISHQVAGANLEPWNKALTLTDANVASCWVSALIQTIMSCLAVYHPLARVPPSWAHAAPAAPAVLYKPFIPGGKTARSHADSEIHLDLFKTFDWSNMSR